MVSPFNKILITGINGFTGKYLETYFLAQGFDVYGTVFSKSTAKNHISCDIRKKSEIENVLSLVKPDYIIHLAAVSFVGESDASLIYDINVLGTENILKVLIQYNIQPQKIILCSSATIYGNQGKTVLDESMSPHPINHYGCSKLSMEYIASNYFNKLNILITRPFNYTGKGQKNHFLIPKIVSHFKENKKEIYLGNIHVAREFNSIYYILAVYHKLLLSNIHSTSVNVSSNKPIKLLEVIDMMQNIAGYKINVKINPDFIRPNEIKSLSGSTTKLSTLIGSIESIDLKETLKEMFH